MEAVQARVDELKPEGADFGGRETPMVRTSVEESEPPIIQEADDIFAQYEPGSAGEKWQKDVLEMFKNDIAKEIHRKWNEMLLYRENFTCARCKTCCNLACSEFSPEELQRKAAEGDNFATQFTGIFVPYQTREEAGEVYPEYLELLNENIDDEVYFYHCPKLNECGLCSDYENRPAICRDFPDNPLSILPEACGFYAWRQEVQPIALMLHSMLEIINYYKEKIEVIRS